MSIGFGLIGAGLWGEMHALIYSSTEGVNFEAVCDINEERAKEIAKKYGVKKWYTRYQDIVDDPDVKALTIATPDFAHKEPAIYAAKMGKHILMEKPLATTVEDAVAINEAVEKAGIIFMVDFHNRWNPPFTNAKDSINKGEIGEPSLIYIRHSNTTFVPFKMLKWSDKSSAAWFLGSHSCDLARWLMGDEVIKVNTISRSKVLASKGLNVPDFFVTTLEFKNGGVAVIENSWILPETMPASGDFRAEILGSKGAVYIDFSNNRTSEIYTEKGGGYLDCLANTRIYGKLGGFCFESIRYYIECIKLNKKPMVTGIDGIANTRIICGMYDSIEKGKAVTI